MHNEITVPRETLMLTGLNFFLESFLTEAFAFYGGVS